MIIIRLWWTGFAVSRETWKPTWQGVTTPATTKSRGGPTGSGASQTNATLRRRGRALVTEPEQSSLPMLAVNTVEASTAE